MRQHKRFALCVDTRIGKAWSKGLTAASDGRVARAAAAHRGLAYRRRPSQAVEWSSAIAYAVGLIATDGCLYRDGRHIAFVSKDEEQMRTFLHCIDRPHLRYRPAQSSTGSWTFRVQVSHVVLYRWLVSIGLTPRKSLVLGALDVPPEHLSSLVRGLLDGDGSIYTGVHRPTKVRYPNYRYERLSASFLSASPAHVEWLRGRLRDALRIEGHVEVRRREGRTTMFRLKYGKRESLVLLAHLYQDNSHPRLSRKWLKWDLYLSRHPQCRRGDLNPHALAGASP